MDTKQALASDVDGQHDALLALSHRVHGLAELGFEEHESSRAVADALDPAFDVQWGVADLDTAFTATYGTGEFVVGICAEYDALPGVGHACGHNIIAAAAVGAGNALARLADDLGITVKLFGTPAEEGGGGKIIMLDAGVFDGVHTAMMVHPAPMETPLMSCLASSVFDIRITGEAAHAAAFPEMGRNAGDALTIAQVGIGLLRQHVPKDVRIHGIVTHGGDAPNVVPNRAEGRWMVRAKDLAGLAEVAPRVHACFEAGALASGTTFEIVEHSAPYSEFHHDIDLAKVWTANIRGLGRDRIAPTEAERAALVGVSGSTDMANVSMAMPTLHPMLAIESNGAVNHQPEFTAACITADADRAVRDGALGMATTVVDLVAEGPLRDRLLAGKGPDATPAEAMDHYVSPGY